MKNRQTDRHEMKWNECGGKVYKWTELTMARMETNKEIIALEQLLLFRMTCC